MKSCEAKRLTPSLSAMSLEKRVSAEQLARIRAQLGALGGRLVFTNGCFDLLHVGHVRYLQAARELGDALAVGVNGDDSVRELKGPSRPLNSEDERAEVLAGLGCVDHVFVFPEVRATESLRIVRPHVYAKGGDYTVESLDAEEVGVLREIGADIQILPLVPGRSTTAIIEKWRS